MFASHFPAARRENSLSQIIGEAGNVVKCTSAVVGMELLLIDTKFKLALLSTDISMGKKVSQLVLERIPKSLGSEKSPFPNITNRFGKVCRDSEISPHQQLTYSVV